MRPQRDDPSLHPTSLSATSSGNNRAQKANNFSRRTWTHDGNDLANRRLSAIGEEDAATSGVFPVQLSVPAEEGEMGVPDSPLLPDQPESNGASNAAGWSSSSSTVSGASEAEGSLKQNGYAASHEGEDQDLSGDNHAFLNLNPPASGEVSVSASPSMVGTSMVPVAEGSTGDEFSSAILGSEAERILDNAKKRLTVCKVAWVRYGLTRVAHGGQPQQSALLSATHAISITVAVWWPAAFRPRPTGRGPLPVDIPGGSQSVCCSSPAPDV